MRFFILHIFMLLFLCSKAQFPFRIFRITLQNNDYQTSQRILDSCSFVKYHQDSVLYYKGLLTLKKGNIKGARTICKNLQKTYPEFTEVHYLSALIYFTDEDYGSSINEFGKVIKTDPNHLKALYNRALAYGMLEDYLSAIEDLGTCIGINPNYAAAYYSRAYWYEYTGNYPEAKKDYEQNIRLEPKNFDAYFGLAYIYHMLKENVKACETINGAAAAGLQIAEELKDNFCR